MRPTISIVTPVLNGAAFIERAMLSVLEQDYPGVELIVMDGGSTDGTTEIIRRHCDRLAFSRSQPDEGQVDALNAGFSRATGTLLGWLNADEEYLPGALRYVAETWAAGGEPELVYGDRLMQDVDAPGSMPRIERIPQLPPFAYMFYTGRSLFSDATFWTRELHHRVGRLDPRYQKYAMDVDWLLRLSGEAHTTAHIAKPLSLFKHHAARVTNQGVAAGIRLNEVIRRRYAAAHGVGRGRLAVGWLWYGLHLRLATHGVSGLLRVPRWDTVVHLFRRSPTD